MGGVLVTVAGVVLALGILLAIQKRGRRGKKSQALSVRMHPPVVHHTTHKSHDYCVRVKADFFNLTHHGIAIERLVIEGVLDSGEHLEPKEVCGDQTRHTRQRSHPPRIMMRMPLSVPHDGQLDYTFDVFFDEKLRRYWDRGRLHMHVENKSGESADAEVLLSAPK
jgi:hypothetical protein